MGKKYLIIHADDAGLAWSQNKATQKGLLEGSISSTSLMVPCPWFYEMAQFCLNNPQLDYGIHLTLTGEWKTYPFRPISAAQKVPSLVNQNGHLFPKRHHIRDQAKVDEVRLELKAQIDFALSLGLKPSHLDPHMYTLGVRQDLLDLYQELGETYRLPIVLNSELISLSGEDPSQFNFPREHCFENIFMPSFKNFEEEGLTEYYNRTLDHLPEGVSMFLIHPALESQEMKQITIDHPNFGAQWRAEESEYFCSEALVKKLKENKIELVNWKSPVVLNHWGA
jgi:predicted glycoside hydrolase/deacetylase ChbG (UPF0249 family)